VEDNQRLTPSNSRGEVEKEAVLVIGQDTDVDEVCDAEADQVAEAPCPICGGPLPPRPRGGRHRVVCARAKCHIEWRRQYDRQWAREHPGRRHRSASEPVGTDAEGAGLDHETVDALCDLGIAPEVLRSIDTDTDYNGAEGPEEEPMTVMSEALKGLQRLFELDDQIKGLQAERKQLEEQLNGNTELASVAKRLGWRPPKASCSGAQKRPASKPDGVPPTQEQRITEMLRGGPLMPAVIAEATGIARASVDAVLGKMLRKGSIARDEDGRRRLVEVA
jgi:hypothetical protein